MDMTATMPGVVAVVATCCVVDSHDFLKKKPEKLYHFIASLLKSLERTYYPYIP